MAGHTHCAAPAAMHPNAIASGLLGAIQRLIGSLDDFLRAALVALPLGLGSAEEALAFCAAERLAVSASRIAYGSIGVDALPAGTLG